jgi:hypothetical protein
MESPSADPAGGYRASGPDERASLMIQGLPSDPSAIGSPGRSQVTTAQTAAIVYALVTVGVIGFQLALAAGAPWGAYAMGGAFPGRFPPRLRVAAVVQAAVLALLAVVVMAKAGLVLPDLGTAAPWTIWLAVAMSALSTVLNAITRSAVERRIWFPVAVITLATSLAVAISA